MQLAVFHRAPQVCIPLFLLLVINTTPQVMARARPCNTTRSITYFTLQAGKRMEGAGWGNRQSSFYRSTPGLTKEYMSPVGHWKQHKHWGSFNCSPCMLGCLITVKSGLYFNMSEELRYWQLDMCTYRIAYGQHADLHTPQRFLQGSSDTAAED